MPELKPCPFCGCEYEKDDDDFCWGGEHADWCPLSAKGGLFGNLIVPDDEAHVEAWNKRTVAPESLRPHGRWIGIEYDGYADGCPVYDLWECSNCGQEESGEDVPEQNPYCRGCGAKMDLEE